MGITRALGIVFFGYDTMSAATAATVDIEKLAYTRSQEIEAHAAALELLRQSGWEPGGLSRLLARLHHQSNEPLPRFTTHPQASGRGEFMPLDDTASGVVVVPPAWQVVQDALQAPSTP